MGRIKQAKIKFISLVPRGANQFPVIYKEDTGDLNVSMLTKASDDFEDRGELLAVVYAPELKDSQGDIASAEVIKEMLYDAAKEGVDIDIRHDEKSVDKQDAYIAEQFIIQKGDPRFFGFKNYQGEDVDVTGGWGVVIKVDSPELRKAYKEGKWNGVSMGGHARMATEKTEQEIEALVARVVQAQTQKPSKPEIDMDKEELEAILKEHTKSVLEEVGKLLPQKKEEDPKKKEDNGPHAPVFKGDASNPEDLKAHQKALVKFNVTKDVDWSDPEQVAKAAEELEKLSKGEEGKKEGKKEENTLPGTSQVPTKKEQVEQIEDMTKEQSEEVHEFEKFAKTWNKE